LANDLTRRTRLISIRTEDTVAFKVAATKEELVHLGEKITLLLFALDGVTAVLEDGSGEESALKALYAELVNVGVRIRDTDDGLPAMDPLAMRKVGWDEPLAAKAS
jgi:hypothetical protein